MSDEEENNTYPMHERVFGDKIEDPKYLKAQDPSTHRKPDEIETWGDYFLRPDKELNQRQLELCRMAAHGKTNSEISQKLNYSANRVSSLLSNQRISDQIQLYRDRLFQTDTKTRMKEIAPDAMDVMTGILRDEHLTLKEKEKAAMWVIEKIDGKAAQQTDVNVTGGVGFFLDKLDQMTERGQTLDVTPLKNLVTAEQESGKLPEEKPAETKGSGDEFTSWLEANMEK